jgi:hypothetical protein
MIEHELPQDPDSWPSDPFRLLGVRPGISTRDLRKAYLRLIKAYKPEHSPVEFQKIRQAYEQALALSSHFRPIGDPLEESSELAYPFESGSKSIEPNEPSRAEPPVPSIDPWDLACDGQPDPASIGRESRSTG